MQHPSLKNYDFFWKRKKQFTLPYRQAFIVFIIWIVCLLFISLGVYLNHGKWSKQKQSLENAVNTSVTQYHETSIAFIGTLDSSDLLSRQGLLPYFAYLSASRHPGVWLSTISIDLQNSHLSIEGNALNTTSANDFFKKLRAESSPFSAWNLINASMNRSSDQYYHFSVEGQPTGAQS